MPRDSLMRAIGAGNFQFSIGFSLPPLLGDIDDDEDDEFEGE